jgi:hypothetical protein
VCALRGFNGPRRIKNPASSNLFIAITRGSLSMVTSTMYIVKNMVGAGSISNA